MNNYEIMLMLFPDMGEKATNETIHEIKDVIGSFHGEIFHEDVWGIRDLAFTIKKQDQGYYIVWNLKLPGEAISELEKILNIHQAVMRYLVTKTPVNYEMKTLEQYDAEREEAEKEAKKKREEAEKEKSAPRPEVKVEKPKPRIEAAVKSTPKAEPKKAEAAPKAPKEEAKNLEDVDAKLKSIIDDPDISL